MSPRQVAESHDESESVQAGQRHAYARHRRYATLAAPVLLAALFGMSGCSDDGDDTESGAGGTTGSGGTTSRGGTSSYGGMVVAGGTTSVGGKGMAGGAGKAEGGIAGQATGGQVSAGGAAGSLSGGGPGAGTAGANVDTAGTAGTAGSAGVGGFVLPTTGGNPGTGGAQATGGVVNGAGSPGTGGAVATGGIAGGTSTGGAVATGTGGTAGTIRTEGGSAGTTGEGGAPGNGGVAGATSTEGGTNGAAGDSGVAGAAGSGGSVAVGSPNLHYDFEEATGTIAQDATMNDNDGTLTSVGWTTTGRNGNGADFNAATSAISIPSGRLVNTHAITVSAWVNLSIIDADTKLFYFGDSAGNAYLTLNLNYSGAIALLYRAAGGTTRQMGTQTQLPLGVWKHISVTASTSGTAIYVDGKIVAYSATVTVDPAALGSTTTDLVGNDYSGSNSLQGYVDEFDVYDGVRPLSEIRTLAWPKNDYSTFHFEEGTGTATEDSSDRNFDGTLMGGATWVPSPFGTGVKLDNPPAATAVQYVTLSGAVVAACGANHTLAGWVSVETHNENARIFEFASSDDYRLNMQTWSTGANNPLLAYELRNISTTGGVGTTTSRIVRVQGLTWPTLQWYHVAAVRSTNTTVAGRLVTVYRDGVAVATNADIKTSQLLSAWPSMVANYFGRGIADTATTSVVTTGTTNPTVVNVSGFDGSLDEMLFACRAYTADEITQLAFKP